MKEQSDKGVRVYLLLGDEKSNQAAIDTLSGRCLIRTGVVQKGALLLVDHATIQAQGILLMCGSPLTGTGRTDNSSWGIQLEPEQIDDCFRSFCKLFWENSSKEFIQQNQRQESVKNPDGSVVTNHSHQLCGTLKDCLSDTLANLRGASQSGFEASSDSYRLLLGSESVDIIDKARNGVALTDRYIPALLLSDAGNWLLPDTTDFSAANWCLKLSKAQSSRLSEAFNRCIEDAAWQYQAEMTLGKLTDQQQLRFADQPDLIRSVEGKRKVPLADIPTTSIDSFIDDDAKLLASSLIGWQRDQLAHQIDYTVVIHPPYSPAGATQDQLYHDWEQAERDWQKRLYRLEVWQQEINKRQASISDKLKGFIKGFLLGQGQSGKKLNQEIDLLKGWSVTDATPSEREENRQRLEFLEKRICQRSADTELELDKAMQNQQWEDIHGSLQKGLADQKTVAKQKADDFEQIKASKKASTDAVEQRFAEAWKKAAENISPQQLDSASVNNIELKPFLPSEMPENKAEQENLKRVALDECHQAKKGAITAMNVEQAMAWKSSLKNKVWKKHYSSFEKALVNRSEALKKIDRDIEEAQKAFEKSQSEQAFAQKALEEHGASFSYLPEKATDAFANQLGLKKSDPASNMFAWPSEELPAGGTELRRHKQSRYLVIFDTDQLPQARKDAERLQAMIVCEREAVNA